MYEGMYPKCTETGSLASARHKSAVLSLKS